MLGRPILEADDLRFPVAINEYMESVQDAAGVLCVGVVVNARFGNYCLYKSMVKLRGRCDISTKIHHKAPTLSQSQ